MRTVETTPTIVRHGPNWRPLFTATRNRRPSALAVPKCLRAKAMLTIATACLLSRSSSLNPRPSTSRWPVTSKKPGVTVSKFACGRSRLSE